MCVFGFYKNWHFLFHFWLVILQAAYHKQNVLGLYKYKYKFCPYRKNCTILVEVVNRIT